ncbi:MAG: RHS repeat-associated core domain-containing protein [Pseudomonadota bacterium]
MDATEHLHFIAFGGSVVATHSQSISANSTTTYRQRYYHTDALGSVSAITNESGVVVDRYTYTVFGKRSRDALAPIGESSTLEDFYHTRGYTGHEELLESDLIHMNGRVYDAELGRFLSADPNVQAPKSTQNYNRYSYVINNPLKYTDPSGYIFGSLLNKITKEFSRFVKRYGATVFTAAVFALPGSPVVVGFLGSFVASAAIPTMCWTAISD